MTENLQLPYYIWKNFLERFMESEKKQKLVIDGNAFYEIDLRCLEKKRKKQEEAKKRQQKRQRR